MSLRTSPATGAALDRVDGVEKVTGAARYAYEYRPGETAYAFLVPSTIAAGRVAAVETARALAIPGVLAVLTPFDAPRLHETPGQLGVLQSTEVAHYGQVVAIAVAESLDLAREAAGRVEVAYEPRAHTAKLDPDGDLYAPDHVNPSYPTDSDSGDVDPALAEADVVHDAVYETPHQHAMPMEPHATLADWTGDGVTLFDANQGVVPIQLAIAAAFDLPRERVRVISPYVGGGFGSKATPKPHHVAAVLAAQVVGRPVRLALSRQQMFALSGYRTPTIQRVRLGATREGQLTAIVHEAVEQTSTLLEFAEQTAVPTRTMYAAPNRRTRHRLQTLDVPVPVITRAPGATPGMFALESAIDELAIALDLDPVELRVRNEPATEPETGRPWSSRGLVACLREGAERFGWHGRDPRPGVRREGRWLVGTGVAASVYPNRRRDASAIARAEPDGRFRVQIAASDMGTGAWTALTQIAADALDANVEDVHVEIGDSALPPASFAGGSMGTASWGTAVFEASQALRAELARRDEVVAPEGIETRASVTTNPYAERYAMSAYGAQFAEVRVDAHSGEVRVPRMTGVFAVGQMINAKTGRSQLLGGMTWGISMALHEGATIDPRFGHFVNQDLAQYHVPVNADVGELDVTWIDEHDPWVNPMGAKGIGELGIVGSAAAIANAVHHATGVRVRSLPIGPDALLAAGALAEG